MKNTLLYTMFLASAWVACDPVEDRQELTGAITAEELVISATPQVVNGKNSNYIQLNSDGVQCLTSWDYGNGVTTLTKATVQLVLQGDCDITFNGRNHDGSMISKVLTVRVDTLINVAKEWGILCGSGEKEWTWDANDPSDIVWGNGGYGGNTSPGWWTVAASDMDKEAEGEGYGASMVFSTKGSSLTKKRTDGSTKAGTFSFDMSKTTSFDDGATFWAIGKLYTKNVGVLAGYIINEGGADNNEYDILTLDEEKMALAAPRLGAGQWGEATFWMFKAK